MAEPTWGQLKKAQDDDTTIDQAIAAAIAAHEADPDAHTGAGESLETHKSQEVIDHPAGSLIEDKYLDGSISLIKLSETKFIIITCFESFDGWLDNSDVGATVQAGVGAGFLITAATSGKKAIIAALPSAPSMSGGVNFGKNPFFQARVYIPATTNQTIYFGTGNASFPASPPTTQYFGFKVVNGTLYAVHSNGSTETTTQITGITLDAKNLYRAVMDSGNNIKFYVNGVLKATHSSNLPSGEEDSILVFMIKTNENAEKELDLIEALFSQDY